MSKILITDDHPLIFKGLAAILADYNPAIQVYYAANIESAKKCLASHPDISLMLLDRNLSGVDSLPYLVDFQAISPQLRIAILSVYESNQQINEVFDAGAAGFIPKGLAPLEIVSAIDKLLKGLPYIPKQNHLLEKPHGLSEHKIKILCLVMKGLSNKEIANQLNLTEGTIKQNLNSIYKFLGAKNRVDAIREARELGLIC